MTHTHTQTHTHTHTHTNTHTHTHIPNKCSLIQCTNHVFSGVPVFLGVGVHETVTLIAPAALLALQVGLPLIGKLGG